MVPHRGGRVGPKCPYRGQLPLGLGGKGCAVPAAGSSHGVKQLPPPSDTKLMHGPRLTACLELGGGFLSPDQPQDCKLIKYSE